MSVSDCIKLWKNPPEDRAERMAICYELCVNHPYLAKLLGIKRMMLRDCFTGRGSHECPPSGIENFEAALELFCSEAVEVGSENLYPERMETQQSIEGLFVGSRGEIAQVFMMNTPAKSELPIELHLEDGDPVAFYGFVRMFLEVGIIPWY